MLGLMTTIDFFGNGSNTYSLDALLVNKVPRRRQTALEHDHKKASYSPQPNDSLNANNDNLVAALSYVDDGGGPGYFREKKTGDKQPICGITALHFDIDSQ